MFYPTYKKVALTDSEFFKVLLFSSQAIWSKTVNLSKTQYPQLYNRNIIAGTSQEWGDEYMRIMDKVKTWRGSFW